MGAADPSQVGKKGVARRAFPEKTVKGWADREAVMEKIHLVMKQSLLVLLLWWVA